MSTWQSCYSFCMDGTSKDFCPNFEAFISKHHYWSQDGVVSLVTRVQTWISRVWILRKARVLSLFQNIQTSAVAHQSSSPKGMEGSFSRGEVARVWRWPFTSIQCIYITALPYLLTYLLTPRSRVLLEKLSGFQLVKKFSAFYETWKFITAFTSARRLSTKCLNGMCRDDLAISVYL
jgi:hypothetical protein